MEAQHQQRKLLPLAIQTFAKIRSEDYYYVDKTELALQLIEQGSQYFLSRPRRFGKSLFLDTLKELFEGNQALFKGLYAEKHWDWSTCYPVIRISLGARVVKNIEKLNNALDKQLSREEMRHKAPKSDEDPPNRLESLIEYLYTQTGQRVVVLVDEYDKPILDNLENPEQAKIMRDALRDFYSILKDSDAYLKFVFLTGVSKFSKVNIFSGLNNLDDITLDERYSAICGYTDTDVDQIFAPELPGLDRKEIRRWYNGYSWLGEAVYNPYDLLQLFSKRKFSAYWFATGTPTFLVDFLAQRQWFSPNLMQRQASEAILNAFDIGNISTEAMLWQTGYLTIQNVEEPLLGHRIYTLDYPNREVETALNEALLPAYGVDAQQAFAARTQLYRALTQQDTEALRKSLHALFASIPHDWYRNNPLAQFEGHYACVFYSQFAALGLNVRGEDATSHGRIDLSLQLGQLIYLFEFKVVEKEAEGKALQQLQDKAYADKFKAPGISILLIGVELSKTERNIVGWEVLKAAG